MTDERDIERGRRAADVLSNEVYQEAYTQVEQGVIALWRDSRDMKEREQLHQMLLMLGKARNVLETAMRTGELAAAELRRKQSLRERAGRIVSGDWR